ncbi:MAG: flavodoxin family protein [Actinomycetota bacterium]
MPRLLVVHHTPSPALHALLDRVLDGATQPELADVEVVTRAALAATPSDVLAADGYVIGSPANLGYLSGAVKHFFDTVYYPCLTETVGRPNGVYLHGNDDCTGALRAADTIITGLGWRAVSEPVVVTGGPGPEDLDRCWELGAVVAANLLEA